MCRNFSAGILGTAPLARKLYLFQPQYANTTAHGREYWLPYSAASTWVYACQDPIIASHYQLAGLYYQRTDINHTVQTMQDPAVCGFSCYVWNEQYNLALARTIKRRWPECVIVFGGPQTGSHHLQHDFIDHIVFSEGETSLLQILQDMILGNATPRMLRLPRMADLDIASVYASGVFDSIIEQQAHDIGWQAVLETNRGCPYACSFCDWGTLTYSKVHKFTMSRIRQDLEWIATNPVTVVFLADANFGIFRDRDLEIAHMIKDVLQHSRVEYLNMTYTKNSNETVFDIADILRPWSRGVTLSMQSMDSETLRISRRHNMASNDLRRQFELAREHDVPTYTDMILGLPGETLESWQQGLVDLLELGTPDFIDTNFANVLPNTELSQVQKFNHGIRTVRACNYQDGSDGDTSGIPEYTELITCTKTMNTDNMVSAWMWHWVLQYFHVSGYSHIVSHWLRSIHGVGLRQFYQDLQQMIICDNGVVGDEYRRTQKQIRDLLTTGSLDAERGTVYELYAGGYVPLWHNIELVRQLISTVIDMHHNMPSSLWLLQCLAVNHPSNSYPETLCTDFHIYRGTPTTTTYRVTVGQPDFDGSPQSFRKNRRSGGWKNIISVL